MKTLTCLALAVLVGLLPTAALEAEVLPTPKSVTVDASLPEEQAQRMIHAAQLFYAFWDTGKLVATVNTTVA